MQLTEQIWEAIDATPSLPAEMKKSLHLRIMRLVEASQASPVGKKLGVTVMTQAASLAGDKVAKDRNVDQLPGGSKPKSV